MPASALLLAASVASLNLCTDEYLLLLAKPEEVASISYLSQDPLESPLWREARRHPANHGVFEQVLHHRPTLLLTMGGGGRATGSIARRLRIKTIELHAPASIADVGFNLRQVAKALGEERRALPLLARLAAIQEGSPRLAKDAIFLTGGGGSLAQGSLAGQWLRLAGLRQRPLADGKASLETLLLRPPAVLVESDYRRQQVSRGTSWLSHPIVRSMKARRVRTDGRAWTCSGPLLIGEIERLRKASQ